MILLWGLPGDDPLDAMCVELERRRVPFTLLDQRCVLEQRVAIEVADGLGGEVSSGAASFQLDDVIGMYSRVYDARQFKRVSEAGTDAWTRVLEVEGALWAWADESEALVINRPSAMASNGSKPYQSAMIEAAGFRIPPTLITTDPDAAAAFWKRHGEVIYKSVSGVRSMVSRLGPDHRERLADIAWCPTQFQAWIAGRDHRVHVVGDDVFAIEVISDADDYRYATRQGTSCELRPTTLPPEIASRAHATAVALDLPVAGLDLRRTPEGEWYCFEVNPSPCFTYYERHTEQPLTSAVASLLAGDHQ